ncbi:MAG: hypothetical protein KAW12_02305 [Candidatus Aminicenantes bacterium]|nr:hypothetical protein [Candidatus Aminicenantes bacterium]
MIVFILKVVIIGFGYIAGYFIGSFLLKRILLFVDPSIKKEINPEIRRIGSWIGACEHFLIVTFVLMKEYTAIGLIFAAKEIVRSKKIEEKASYYLLGTLLSVSFAILFGVLTCELLKLIG